jgi:hypothetical protein
LLVSDLVVVDNGSTDDTAGIGDGLRSRIDERRVTEVEVAVHVLNRMLALGRPNYVRIV